MTLIHNGCVVQPRSQLNSTTTLHWAFFWPHIKPAVPRAQPLNGSIELPAVETKQLGVAANGPNKLSKLNLITLSLLFFKPDSLAPRLAPLGDGIGDRIDKIRDNPIVHHFFTHFSLTFVRGHAGKFLHRVGILPDRNVKA